ncbi:hypothetical protein JCM8097_007113 [Rhodosporidiobolus ruineniae]
MAPERSSSSSQDRSGPSDRPLATTPQGQHPPKTGAQGRIANELFTRFEALEATVTTLTSRIAILEEGRVSTAPLSVSPAAASPAASSSSTPTLPRPPTLGYGSERASQAPSQLSNQPAHPSPLNPGVPSPATSVPSTKSDLPPIEVLSTLFDLFFDNVAAYAPLVLRTDLEPTIVPDGTLEWPIVVYGVVAASLRFSFDPFWASLPSKESYHEAARNRVILHSTSTTSVASLQALTLVALDDLISHPTPQSWGALALVTRTAAHMLLYQEEPNVQHSNGSHVSPLKLLGTSSSFFEEECRRRLFWSMFLLDRWSASATGWDFAFSEQQIARKLPAPAEAWPTMQDPTTAPLFRSAYYNPSSLVSPQIHSSTFDVHFTALIEIIDLLGHVHQLHRVRAGIEDVQLFVQGTQGLEQRLESWFASLPSTLTDPCTASTHRQIPLMQALYHATCIKLQSLVAYPLFRNLTPNIVSIGKAHTSALAIAALTRTTPIRSPYFAWAAFVAARILFLRAHQRREPLDPAIHDLLQAFKAAAPSCNLAQRYLDLFARGVRRLNSVDGTLGGAAALVDLHHTTFSAESAVLPTGMVTPTQPDEGVPNIAAVLDFSRLAALTGEGGFGGMEEGPAPAEGEADAVTIPADVDMAWFDELLGHSGGGWFDLPHFLADGHAQ